MLGMIINSYYLESIIFSCSRLILCGHSFIIEIIILEELLQILVPTHIHAFQLFFIPCIHGE